MLRPRLLLASLAFTGAMVAAATKIDVTAQKPYDIPVVPTSSVARWLSLGHPSLAANLLWLRAVQYIGEPRAEERGWGKLFPLLDTITDLDPGHGYAYQVGGVVLGSAGRTAESNAILEKGIRNVPNRYILPYLRAFNAFYYDDDWTTAGRFAEIAARTPGAPAHVSQNVLAYYVKGNRADAAVSFLEQSLAEAEDPDTRKAVRSQLQQARVEQAVARLDEAVDAWRGRYLTGPLAIQQLVEEGLVEAIPRDPAGGELYIGDDGRVRSSANPYRVGRPEKARQVSPEPGMKMPHRRQGNP